VERRFSLLLTVLFARHLPRHRLRRILAEHRAAHAARAARYDQMHATTDDTTDPYAAAVLDFGRRYERAVLDWFAALPPELTTGAGQ